MNEIDILEKRLNDLQSIVYTESRNLTENEKAEWRKAVGEIRSLGYVLRKSRKAANFHRTTWHAVQPEDSINNECKFIYTDNRPKDGRRVLKGDCTTRALAIVFEGMKSYREIEREQYALAAEYHTVRNRVGVWDMILSKNGYVEVRFGYRRIKRSVLANLLAGRIAHPVVSRSSGHVAVIDQNGAVRDIWDSRGGKVKSIFVEKGDYVSVMDVLKARGIVG